MLRSSLKLPLDLALKTFFKDGSNTTPLLPSMSRFLLLQNGFKLLLQNGDKILITETSLDETVVSFSNGFNNGFAIDNSVVPNNFNNGFNGGFL